MPRYELYRRHADNCPDKKSGVVATRCRCPIWAYARHTRERFSIHTRDWGRAEKILAKLDLGQDPDAAAPSVPPIPKVVDLYVADCRSRKLADSSIVSYLKTLNPLIAFCKERGVSHLERIDVQFLSEFRAYRKVGPATANKELECLRTFCSWCMDRRWLDENPAKRVRPTRDAALPTAPFDRKEVDALLNACEAMRNNNTHTMRIAKPRAKALVYLLLYSGLRISDAANLRRGALNPATGHLTLRTLKTGTPVKVKLPDVAIRALDAMPFQTYFFRNHTTLKQTIKSLQRTIARLGKIAKVHAHPHRFRDTFAVELLSKGADMWSVQMLLGHTSLKTTEKHYARFVAAHQSRLDSATAGLDFVHDTPRPFLIKTGND